MSEKRRVVKRSRLGQYVALAIFLTTAVLGALWVRGQVDRILAYPERPGAGSAATIELEVPRGSGFTQVLGQLVDAGVIPADEAIYFKLFVLHRGVAAKITAGQHTLRADMTPTEIVDELLRPQPAPERRVTIPEGRNMLQVAEILDDAGFGAKDQLLAAMRDEALLKELEIDAPSVEGYLYPDTYLLQRGASPEQIIRRLVARHRQVYADLRRRHLDATEQLDKTLGWGDREIVILASIVEKETAAKHERPLIAGVFLNRLRFQSFQPKRLETDPTIIYGCTVPVEKSAACQEFEGRIRRIHLRDKDNPYNTYTHEGLPPGPIANPGEAALEAVLAPKKSRFLYFVSRNDGTHQFSKSMADHERAVEKYMRQGAVGDGSAAGSVDPAN
ncbi:MAG: endolytic transglycosylase MltG [Nannocystaceae bacterium]